MSSFSESARASNWPTQTRPWVNELVCVRFSLFSSICLESGQHPITVHKDPNETRLQNPSPLPISKRVLDAVKRATVACMDQQNTTLISISTSKDLVDDAHRRLPPQPLPKNVLGAAPHKKIVFVASICTRLWLTLSFTSQVRLTGC